MRAAEDDVASVKNSVGMGAHFTLVLTEVF